MHNPRAASGVQSSHNAQDTLVSPLQDRQDRSRSSAYDYNTQRYVSNGFEDLKHERAAPHRRNSMSGYKFGNGFKERLGSREFHQTSTFKELDFLAQNGAGRVLQPTPRTVLQPLSTNTGLDYGRKHLSLQHTSEHPHNERLPSGSRPVTQQLPTKSPRKLLWPQASSTGSTQLPLHSRAFQQTTKTHKQAILASQARSYHHTPLLSHSETSDPNVHNHALGATQARAGRSITFADPFAGSHEKYEETYQTSPPEQLTQEQEVVDIISATETADAPIHAVHDATPTLESSTDGNQFLRNSLPGPDVPIHVDETSTEPAQDPAAEPKATQTREKIVEVRRLHKWQLLVFRFLFGGTIICANISLLVVYFFTHHHLYLLAILVFMKSKDLLSTLIGALGIMINAAYYAIRPPPEVAKKWILSLVSVYAETDDQIWKTIASLVTQKLTPHRQVICIIVDGKNPQVLSRFTHITHAYKRPYMTWKGATGELVINAGFIDQTPIVFMRKMQNAGKKDSLILAHDLFNSPRKNMPRLTKEIRSDMEALILPQLTQDTTFSGFNGVFCTDADSTVHEDALRKLMDALVHKKNSIAACGILVAELSVPRIEWSMWHLYQQFQYTFGQFVRRQAEGIWGRVTCLPGCITMIAVRPEMGPAIAQYARPVTSLNVFEHQVQYLGTDRRLTWCILSQGAHLTSLFVPAALCETVVPENLEHYLSQRRRWASNAYFNDYFYAFGREQRLITRLFALIDIVRQTLVFYRVINTALFLHSLITRFYILKITPTLILTKTPAAWFLILALTTEPILRKRLHKLLSGMCINQCISPILSVIVFANVLLSVGSQVWGTTGVSSLETRTDPAAPATIQQQQQQMHMQMQMQQHAAMLQQQLYEQQQHQLQQYQQQQYQQHLQQTPLPPSEQMWTPRRLGKIVQSAVRGFTSPIGRRVRGNSQSTRSHAVTSSPEYVQQTRVPATPGTSSAVFSPTATRKRSPPTARRPNTER